MHRPLPVPPAIQTSSTPVFVEVYRNSEHFQGLQLDTVLKCNIYRVFFIHRLL